MDTFSLVTFKCILDGGGGGGGGSRLVRLVTLESDDATFSALRRKISEYFAFDSSGDKFSLSYDDEEGDRVTVGTEEEFRAINLWKVGKVLPVITLSNIDNVCGMLENLIVTNKATNHLFLFVQKWPSMHVKRYILLKLRITQKWALFQVEIYIAVKRNGKMSGDVLGKGAGSNSQPFG